MATVAVATPVVVEDPTFAPVVAMEEAPTIDAIVRGRKDGEKQWFDKMVFLTYLSSLEPAIYFGNLFQDAAAVKPEKTKKSSGALSRYSRDKVDTWAKFSKEEVPSGLSSFNTPEMVISMQSAAPSYGRMSNYRPVRSGSQKADAIVMCVEASVNERNLQAHISRMKDNLTTEITTNPKAVMMAYFNKKGIVGDKELKEKFCEDNGLLFFDFTQASSLEIRQQVLDLLVTPPEKFIKLELQKRTPKRTLNPLAPAFIPLSSTAELKLKPVDTPLNSGAPLTPRLMEDQPSTLVA